MWYSEQHGVIKTPREFTINGATYPRQVFRQWSKPKLAELGIRPARVVTPDSRYFNTGSENYELVDGEWIISYVETEKEVEPIKEQLISKVKQHVASTLAPSDWRIIREQEGYKVAGDEWKTWRGSVRDHGNELEESIYALTDMDSLRAFQNHDIIEVRYISTYNDDEEEVIGPETEELSRSVDKINWDWPVSPDAEVDLYHVEYK